MKLLIITYTFSHSSPAGQVFTALVNEMAAREGVKITSISIPCNSLVKSINHLKIQNKKQLKERVHKILMLLTGFAFENFFRIKRVNKEAIRCLSSESYDCIISLVNGDKPEILNLGYELSLKFKIPLYVHMVDPIPPPKHWGLNKHYWNSLRKYVMPGLKHAKFLSFGNKRMLEYQDSLYDFDILKKSFIVPDAVNGAFKVHGNPMLYSDKVIFTFLGAFYGKRKPNMLFKGFEIFLKAGNNAEIHIYSKNAINLEEYNLEASTKSKILFFKFTDKLDEVIKKSTILLDVDIAEEGNVFSSSKLKRYLFNDRFILCVTKIDSPSYDICNILSNSCTAVDHDENLIATSMKKIIDLNYSSDIFKERVEVIEKYKASNIADIILNKLKQDNYD